MRSFVKINPLQNSKIILSFIYCTFIDKVNHALVVNLNVVNNSFTANLENFRINSNPDKKKQCKQNQMNPSVCLFYSENSILITRMN